METLYAPQAMLGTPHVGFFAIIIIGDLAGWLAGMVVGSRHWIFTNILIGITGSYIGSELSKILNIVVDTSLMHLIVVFAGSVILLTVWRALHPSAAVGGR